MKISDRGLELACYAELARFARSHGSLDVAQWVTKWVTQMEESTSPLKRPLRIGLTGYATSGKDTVAALLSMYGARPLSFAFALRWELDTVLRTYQKRATSLYDGSGGWEVPDSQRANIAVVCERKESPWTKPTSPEMRELLQTLGSERRSQDLHYWVKRLLLDLREGGHWVISDVRYANEAAMIRDSGGVIWRVDRPNVGPVNDHESEHQGLACNYIIYNSGSVVDLAATVRQAVNRFYVTTDPAA